MGTPMSTRPNHNHSSNDGGFVDFRMHRGADIPPSSGVSALEQQVLDEYARLAGNMEKLSTTLTNLTTTTDPSSSSPASPPQPPQRSSITPALPPQLTLQIAESLRLLERQVASVYTLMKASVYSIVLQQGDMDMDVEGGGDVSRGDVTGMEESRIG